MNSVFDKWENNLAQEKCPTQGSRLAGLKCFLIFNLAAVVGFITGFVSFLVAMYFYPNDTFGWLFSNVVGGLSHFTANYFMQRQTSEKIAKNFIVFNATGIIGFLAASSMFALSLILIGEPNVSWLLGSMVGTTSHYVLNNEAMKINFGDRNSTKRQPSN
jgi:putative flippase GtrA